jgi:DNA-binding beta-propeller fold protein YncE
MGSSVFLAGVLAIAGPQPTLTSAVGTGQAGYDGDGGPAARARLNMPFDVAVDARGNLFLSDTFNHCLRRVDGQTGTITTIAGNGAAGFSGDGGPAVKAQLNEPYGIVVGTNEDLFVADRLNRRVRRVDLRSGTITTVAGNGAKIFGGDGGPGMAAGLVEPNGVALARDGRVLYIADVAGHRIRRLDLAAGQIATLAGTGAARHDGDGGPAERASIWGARAVDVGPDGSVFILEREGNSLRVIRPDTRAITTIAGTGARGYTGDGGPAESATLSGPKELAVDRFGNVWIVDTENHAIRVIDAATHRIRTVAGNGRPGGDGDGGPATMARLDRPHGVAVGPDGSCWIGDTHNHRVRLVSPGK